jgi:hypothetical protein
MEGQNAVDEKSFRAGVDVAKFSLRILGLVEIA